MDSHQHPLSPTEASDRLARTVFLCAVGGAVTFAALVALFVL